MLAKDACYFAEILSRNVHRSLYKMIKSQQILHVLLTGWSWRESTQTPLVVVVQTLIVSITSYHTTRRTQKHTLPDHHFGWSPLHHNQTRVTTASDIRQLLSAHKLTSLGCFCRRESEVKMRSDMQLKVNNSDESEPFKASDSRPKHQHQPCFSQVLQAKQPLEIITTI